MKNKPNLLKLVNSLKKDGSKTSNKPPSKGSFSSLKSYQAETKNIPIAKSLNSSNVKKRNGNYNKKKGDLGFIKTSLFSMSKNIRKLKEQNEVFINTIKSEQEKTTKALKKNTAEIKGMKDEQKVTNKLLKELISIVKEDKKDTIQVNKDNPDQKDNKIKFMNEKNNNNEFVNDQRYMDIFSSQSDIKSDNIVNINNVINDIVSSEEKEGRQIKKEEKKEKGKISFNEFKIKNNIKKLSFINSAKKK